MAADCEALKEEIRELKDEAKAERKSFRERIHKTENNIANLSELFAKTTTNLNWIMSELEEFEEIKVKIENLRTDFHEEKEERFKEKEAILKEKLRNKTTTIQKFWDSIFSYKTLVIVSFLFFGVGYIADKISLAHHMENISGMKNG